MDIEVAYNLLQSKENSETEEEDALDTNYKKLHCDLQVLSAEMVAKVTHCPSSCYKLHLFLNLFVSSI